MLRPKLGPFLISIERVGIVDRSLRWPRLARRRALRHIGDRVGQGRDTASEPYSDVSAASVHRLKNGDRLAFLHPLTDQRRPLRADIAQLSVALAEDGDRVIVEWVSRLEAQIDRVARRGQRSDRSTIPTRSIRMKMVPNGEPKPDCYLPTACARLAETETTSI